MKTGSLEFNPAPKLLALAGDDAGCGALLASLQARECSAGLWISRVADLSADCDADCIVFAIGGDEMDAALPAIKRAHARHPFIPILAALKNYCDASACRAFRAGACEVLPFDEVTAQIESWRHSGSVSGEVEGSTTGCEREMERWIGSSPSARHLRSWIPRVAATDCNVLITGETGSGKELIADLIHSSSRRSKYRLVCINCAAVPETLLESELFGHERGSFTGAMASREGAFEAAHGGTVFLDEIGEMTPLAQAKILRALETRQVQRVGSTLVKQLDIRIVAATNQPLGTLVENGRFRMDLMYRLKVAQVELPPLRERREDIPALLKHFLSIFNRKHRGQIAGFSAEAMRKLLAHDWPGNVRELRNLVEFLYVSPSCARIQADDLPLPGPKDFPSDDRKHLMETLASVQWNKSAAARILKWSRMTVYRKMAKYEIAKRDSAARAAAGSGG